MSDPFIVLISVIDFYYARNIKTPGSSINKEVNQKKTWNRNVAHSISSSIISVVKVHNFSVYSGVLLSSAIFLIRFQSAQSIIMMNTEQYYGQ